MAKNKSTRNTAFNGYEFEMDGEEFYATVTTSSVEELKKITKKYYSNIKLLDCSEYVKVKGTDIVSYTVKSKDLLTYATNGYDSIIQNIGNKDYYIFGAPYRMVLDDKQAFSNCGVDSVLNNLVNAGIMKIEDQDKTEKSFLKKMWKLGLAADNGELGVLDKNDGTTTILDYKEMFAIYGIETSLDYSSSITNLAKLVKEGHGVILSVSSERLWFKYESYNKINHAISVIGVVYDTGTPLPEEMPVAFVIQDTGLGQTRFITLDDLKFAGLYTDTKNNNENLSFKNSQGFIISKSQNPIKTMADNIKATGDKFDNIIYGNSANNVIKGLEGNDTLNGEGGNDTIYGGSGKDTIYGDYGNDVIYGGSGNDLIYGDEGNDIIYGGKGNDTIYGGDDENTIYAEDRNVIYGEDGNDVIICGNSENRVLGGNGNDTIYGGADQDTLIAGDGNDVIYASDGKDKVEVGAGKDTVIFDDPEYDITTVYNSKGSVTFKFEYDVNTYKMTDAIGREYDSKSYDLYFTDSGQSKGFILKDFFNYKKDTSKTAYLELDSGRKYKYKATKSAKATVADTRTDGNHKNINNVLFTTNKKGTTITTSKKNDIVYMYDSPNYYYNEAECERKDKITYTGGKDTYYSFIGNTTYVVKFSEQTVLGIGDSIVPIYKIKYDENGEPDSYLLDPSNNDTIKFSSSIDNITFLFDMNNNGKTTEKTNLLAFYNPNNGTESLENNIKSYISGNKDTTGYVAIAEFFNQNKTFGSDDCYGNGLIENIYTKEKGKDVLYTGLETRIEAIQTAVMNWFNDNSGYTSVFEALNSEIASEKLTALVNCYNPNV